MGLREEGRRLRGDIRHGGGRKGVRMKVPMMMLARAEAGQTDTAIWGVGDGVCAYTLASIW